MRGLGLSSTRSRPPRETLAQKVKPRNSDEDVERGSVFWEVEESCKSASQFGGAVTGFESEHCYIRW